MLYSLAEREKRKDELLESQKSKQERTDSELRHLRQVELKSLNSKAILINYANLFTFGFS